MNGTPVESEPPTTSSWSGATSVGEVTESKPGLYYVGGTVRQT